MLDGGERRCSLSWYNTQVCCSVELRRSNVGGVSVRAGSGADSTQAHDGAPRRRPSHASTKVLSADRSLDGVATNVSGPSARLLATRCRKPPQRRQHRHQGTHAHIHTRTPSNPSLAHTCVLRGCALLLIHAASAACSRCCTRTGRSRSARGRRRHASSYRPRYSSPSSSSAITSLTSARLLRRSIRRRSSRSARCSMRRGHYPERRHTRERAAAAASFRGGPACNRSNVPDVDLGRIRSSLGGLPTGPLPVLPSMCT